MPFVDMAFVLTWTCCFAALSLRAIQAARSPIIMAIACVGVDGMRGATDASATLNPETPCTLHDKRNHTCDKQVRVVGARTRSHARAYATFPGSASFELRLKHRTFTLGGSSLSPAGGHHHTTECREMSPTNLDERHVQRNVKLT